MTQANDSHAVAAAGAGPPVATHLIASKEYQVVILAGDGGHLLGTKPSYFLWLPAAAVGANKLHGDIFNAAGSGKVMEVNGIWAIAKQDALVTNTLAAEVDLYRTSAVGTGGTAALVDRTTQTVPAFQKKDQLNAAIPAQVTARAAPTGGATIAGIYFGQYLMLDEGSVTSSAGAAVGSFTNLLPEMRETQIMTIREGEGLLMKQGAVATAGSIAWLIDFSLI